MGSDAAAACHPSVELALAESAAFGNLSAAWSLVGIVVVNLDPPWVGVTHGPNDRT